MAVRGCAPCEQLRCAECDAGISRVGWLPLVVCVCVCVVLLCCAVAGVECVLLSSRALLRCSVGCIH